MGRSQERIIKKCFHQQIRLQMEEFNGLGIWGCMEITPSGTTQWEERTPLFDVPDVLNGQPDWFIQDHITSNGTSHQKLHLDPDEFVVVLWVGTNDVGINSFVTDDQKANISLVDLAECQMDTLKRMRSLGARRFILNSLIPLQLTRLYSNRSDLVIHWPEEHDGPSLNEQWASRSGGYVEYFDSYAFFEEVYRHPDVYFNGSVPANVTGWCHQCPDPLDFHFCGIGDCTEAERDSYMWWDELHPSEQTGRNVAMELFKKIKGVSRF
ncbi:hypothetical protein K435DRAFT_869531 [Dendrothele bispora CBS 962.96]|uniref:Carbohydrate esterase family 16 protein n=1 Tax=Dendrothele bispora (strain CBS 962.96) TaxID=1314807 RepID=A0A4V6T543_DENBC|nr:hypothetical protein K435DRAFT_869531 [Dendrothele bispora CBS 962.96]